MSATHSPLSARRIARPQPARERGAPSQGIAGRLLARRLLWGSLLTLPLIAFGGDGGDVETTPETLAERAAPTPLGQPLAVQRLETLRGRHVPGAAHIGDAGTGVILWDERRSAGPSGQERRPADDHRHQQGIAPHSPAPSADNQEWTP